ncbi:MAG: cation:proton antiporter regulatory subunit [Microthrixaceae bacterium]
MTEIDETELPGIGLRREFTTHGGLRLGVIANRTGSRDLLLYDGADPDVCRSVVPLDDRDSEVLADLLGGDQVRDAATTLLNIEGLAIDWLSIDPESDLAGKRIGEAEIRSTTGATVAAVIDEEQSVPGPGPEVVLPAGGVVVAVGSTEAVKALAALLAG